jgi:lipoate-protein ligase A
MQLDLLPTRAGGAAENMAVDFLLLQRYPVSENARFRHYNWFRPAFTFGYSQPLGYAKEQLPADEPMELCRRPTGGGVVDHRNDWTYALVIPDDHALFEAPAPESYRVVHACIADTFHQMGEPALLKEPKPATDTNLAGSGPGVCFTRAENYDVVHPVTGAKIAGAAQKRSKKGMLFQGSIARSAVSTAVDWDRFEKLLIASLAQALGLSSVRVPWPEFAEEEVSALTEQYSGEEWNAFR